MGLTTIQEFVVDTLIEKQSITKEKLSNALDQILSSEGIDKFLGLLIQEKPVDKKLNKGYGISLISLVDAIPVDLPFVMSHKEACNIGRELTELGVKTATTFY